METKNNETFGAMLTRLVEQHPEDKVVLAGWCNCSVKQLNRLCKEISYPNLDTAEWMATVFNLQIDEMAAKALKAKRAIHAEQLRLHKLRKG